MSAAALRTGRTCTSLCKKGHGFRPGMNGAHPSFDTTLPRLESESDSRDHGSPNGCGVFGVLGLGIFCLLF